MIGRQQFTWGDSSLDNSGAPSDGDWRIIDGDCQLETGPDGLTVLGIAFTVLADDADELAARVQETIKDFTGTGRSFAYYADTDANPIIAVAPNNGVWQETQCNVSFDGTRLSTPLSQCLVIRAQTQTASFLAGTFSPNDNGEAERRFTTTFNAGRIETRTFIGVFRPVGDQSFGGGHDESHLAAVTRASRL